MPLAQSNFIPLRAVDLSVVQAEVALSQQLLTPRTAKAAIAHLVNYDALGAQERHVVDEGDLLPAWAYWWLVAAQNIVYDNRFSDRPVLLSPRPSADTLLNSLKLGGQPSWQVAALSVADVCHPLTNQLNRLGLVMAWGVESQQVAKPRFPLACDGFMATMADGLGVLSVASAEESAWLGLPAQADSPS